MAKDVIEGKRIFLRPLTKRDAKALAKLAHDFSNARFLNLPYPYKLKDAYAFIKEIHKMKREGKQINWGIFRKETGALMGNIALINISEKSEHAEIGYWIGKPFRKKGYTTEAARLVVDYGFRKKKFNRIEILCSAKNKASEKVIKEKLQATFEGLLRKRTKSRGREWHDDKIFSILKEEYPNIRKKWR